MIFESLVGAGAHMLGFTLLYRRAPEPVKKFIKKHPFASEATAAYVTYKVMGGSATGLMTAAWVTILTSAALNVAKDPDASAALEEGVQACKQAVGSGFQGVMGAVRENLAQHHRANLKEVKEAA